MGLRAIGSSLARLPPSLGAPRDEHGHCRAAEPWRAWYKLAEWRRLRWATLVRDAFTCRMCGRLQGDPRHLVADHVQPHRGDRTRFFDPANLQTLCDAPCHASLKQAAERASP